jgi:hypothetical protein
LQDKDKLLYLVPELICWTDETRILPSGSDAVAMWASGLGSTQTTPSTSTQAAPAPRIDCDTKVRMFNTWLDLLTNPVTEGFYDC